MLNVYERGMQPDNTVIYNDAFFNRRTFLQNNEVKFENRSKNIYELYKLLYCLVRYRKLLSHATVKFQNF
jgi:hypothetical protein